MFQKLTVKDINPEGKKVFLRVDFNVPLSETLEVQDDLRIRRTLPTINHLLDSGAALIIASHLGRPKGKVVKEMSLAPVARKLSELLVNEVKMAPDCIGKDVETMAEDLSPGEILLLENLRFHKEETDNEPGFAKKLASLVDIYVNDAFGAAHRAHASTEGITRHIEKSVAGFLMEKEIEYLGNSISKPKRPFLAIIGGAKVSSKIDVIKSLLDKCDCIILGGAMVYTFMKAEGQPVGDSLVEDDKLDSAKEIMQLAKDKDVGLILPTDHVLVKEIEENAEQKIVNIKKESIPDGWKGVDIGPVSISFFRKKIKGAKTIVWNGPMGIFEIEDFAAGTNAVAKAVAQSSAISIIGGGDSASAIKKSGFAEKVSHVSTGGGASLDFLASKILPGVDALTDR